MVEKKISSNYAFSDNHREKMQINGQIYTEMCEKYRISYGETDKQTEYDVILQLISNRPGNKTYEIIKNEPQLNKHELALICDQGNLCFGFMSAGTKITIYTD